MARESERLAAKSERMAAICQRLAAKSERMAGNRQPFFESGCLFSGAKVQRMAAFRRKALGPPTLTYADL
jgi:hypothetical protein